nr:hypothetical protein [Tanacetum cinerariifolium]
MTWKVKLLVVGRGRAGKGGSCVLIPNLVVMAKVGTLGLGVSLLLIVENVSSGQAYLLGRDVMRTFISLTGSFAVIANQVALFLKWKKRSWMVIVRPTDRLDTRRIHLFDSILLLHEQPPDQGKQLYSPLYELKHKFKKRTRKPDKKSNEPLKIESPKPYTNQPFIEELFVVTSKLNMFEEKVETPPDSPPIIIIDTDDQPMWSSTRIVAPTPKPIEESEIKAIPTMPNLSLIKSNSPTVSPFLKDSTVHIPYTNAKTFADDELMNHVGDNELKSIDDVETRRMTKKEKDDMGLPKEPKKE